MARIHKILIVEDDPELAQLTQINFPKDRFDVSVAHDGVAALHGCGQNKPDLIILDVIMPVKDGWETLIDLKAQDETSSIPVIMCTAKDSHRDIDKSFHYGAQAYVMKPIQFPILLKKVAAILNIEDLLHD